MNSVLQSVLSAPPESGPAADFMWDLQQALRAPVKSISPKHFYDTRGSALFDRICDLPEYYPTRTEMAILRHHAGDIAARMGADAELVEFGVVACGVGCVAKTARANHSTRLQDHAIA